MDQNPYNNTLKEFRNSSLYTVQLVNTPKKFKTIRNWLSGVFLLLFLSLFLPWQQNINGKGKVTPFAPEDRPQNVPSIIGGRIEKWKVVEGQFVKKGDTLVIISEVKEKFFDPELLDRTQKQIVNKEDGLKAKNRKILALEKQINALKNSVAIKLKMAKNKVLQAQFTVKAEKGNFDASKTNEELSRNQYERLNELYKKGLASLTEIQNRTNKMQEAKSKAIESENKYDKAENELINARIDLNFIEAEYLDKISKAESILEETAGELFESQAELIKLRIEYSNLLLRSGFYAIKAPQDGYLVQVLKAGIGETIKENENLATIVPANTKTAVEMTVRALDMPLLFKGCKVRIQFDGWPALVFSGWPSGSVGTFGGVVQAIDRNADEKGNFRILVVQDPTDVPWPELIRAGGGVYGWAMLNRVPVWYELWRQFNAFPPDFMEEANQMKKDADTKTKKDK
ncbi:MAG: HlyD family efflux transporter periplasmic adaptor subunit [Bacteroidetes bacterium]|nr:HlyD family efflux transporter periplasmic adaptor subunit [Bacteroidota bacterium]